mmetsp:Transcript_62548/g.204133  ORF Transcript_62548/g.204133 Transcript_62548/m.204133 type:complete len:110 (+) Transcript_62548:2563-2892(+)
MRAFPGLDVHVGLEHGGFDKVLSVPSSSLTRCCMNLLVTWAPAFTMTIIVGLSLMVGCECSRIQTIGKSWSGRASQGSLHGRRLHVAGKLCLMWAPSCAPEQVLCTAQI